MLDVKRYLFLGSLHTIALWVGENVLHEVELIPSFDKIVGRMGFIVTYSAHI